jgi:hypothetical protein
LIGGRIFKGSVRVELEDMAGLQNFSPDFNTYKNTYMKYKRADVDRILPGLKSKYQTKPAGYTTADRKDYSYFLLRQDILNGKKPFMPPTDQAFKTYANYQTVKGVLKEDAFNYVWQAESAYNMDGVTPDIRKYTLYKYHLDILNKVVPVPAPPPPSAPAAPAAATSVAVSAPAAPVATSTSGTMSDADVTAASNEIRQLTQKLGIQFFEVRRDIMQVALEKKRISPKIVPANKNTARFSVKLADVNKIDIKSGPGISKYNGDVKYDKLLSSITDKLSFVVDTKLKNYEIEYDLVKNNPSGFTDSLKTEYLPSGKTVTVESVVAYYVYYYMLYLSYLNLMSRCGAVRSPTLQSCAAKEILNIPLPNGSGGMAGGRRRRRRHGATKQKLRSSRRASRSIRQHTRRSSSSSKKH